VGARPVAVDARTSARPGRSPGGRSLSIAAAALLCASCCFVGPVEPSERAVRASFARHRSTEIAGVRLEQFLRCRTAMVMAGPRTLEVADPAAPLDGRTGFRSDAESPARASRGCAAALSADGYFLTAAHCLAAGPAHVVIEIDGWIRAAPARTVWSDGERDIALVRAELRPDAWFEWEPERRLPARERVFGFSHADGGVAGRLEVATDIPALGPYITLAIPHDAPLRKGTSGGPAIADGGGLLGVMTSSGKDTVFRRRSWFVRPSPDELQRRIEEDRRGPGASERR
jgi:S1-C subfamily serine protease